MSDCVRWPALLLFYSTKHTTTTATTAKQWKILFFRHLFFSRHPYSHRSQECTEKNKIIAHRRINITLWIMHSEPIRARGISSLRKLTIVNITGFRWINFQCSTVFMWSLTVCASHGVRYALERCHCWFQNVAIPNHRCIERSTQFQCFRNFLNNFFFENFQKFTLEQQQRRKKKIKTKNAPH